MCGPACWLPKRLHFGLFEPYYLGYSSRHPLLLEVSPSDSAPFPVPAVSGSSQSTCWPLPQFSLASDGGCWLLHLSNLPAGEARFSILLLQDILKPLQVFLWSFISWLWAGKASRGRRRQHFSMNSAPHPKAQDGPTLPAVFIGALGGKSWEEKGLILLPSVWNQIRWRLASDFVWLLCGHLENQVYGTLVFSCVWSPTRLWNSVNLAVGISFYYYIFICI